MNPTQVSPESSVALSEVTRPASAAALADVAPELAEVGRVRAALAVVEEPVSEAVAIDWVHELEALKSVAAAAQARVTAALAQLRATQEREAGVVTSRRGKGLAAEIALARGDAPAKGTKHLQLAQALTNDLPNTMAALEAGVIHEDHAQVVATETAVMAAADRRTVDARLAEQFAGLGPRTLGELVRGHVHELDHAGAVKRHAQARAQRRVSLRPGPAGMAQLTALLPLHQAAAVHDTLQQAAVSRVSTGGAADADGKTRTTDQVMADLLVEQLTHQDTATLVPAEIQVVMTDTALFGDANTPAWVPGHGHIPAAIAKHWLAHPDTALRLRRLYTRPDNGHLVGMEARSRTFPDGLRHMITLRDGTCRTPYCDAPIRHIDHISPARDGGTTSWANASGLCAACNQTKENTGWCHTGDPDQLTVQTPTGHDYITTTQPLRGTSPPDTTGPPDTGPSDAGPPDTGPPDQDDREADPPPTRTTTCNLRIHTTEPTLHTAA